MTTKSFLEPLASTALDSQMPQTPAILLNTGPVSTVLDALGRLCMPQDLTVYYILDPMGTRTAEVLQRCDTLGLPCIVLCSGEEPAREVIDKLMAEGTQAPDTSECAASLISPGDPRLAALLTQEAKLPYFAWIAFQQYFCPRSFLSELNHSHYETLRLGLFRENPQWAEPLIREAHYHLTDMRALRRSDTPDGLQTGPNGLYAEEFCTLCRYMGLSNKPKVCHFFGYPATGNEAGTTLQTLAQGLWHLIEALSANFPENPRNSRTDTLQKKCVQIGEKGQDIVFFHSLETGRWWLEITNIADEANPWYIACSLDDYEKAIHGELPLRWIKYYQHYNKL